MDKRKGSLKYEDARIEVLLFDCSDIVTASGGTPASEQSPDDANLGSWVPLK